MSSSDNEGKIGTVLWIVAIITIIGSGVMAWNFMEPKSFLGAIGFLILWVITSKVGLYFTTSLVLLLGGKN